MGRPKGSTNRPLNRPSTSSASHKTAQQNKLSFTSKITKPQPAVQPGKSTKQTADAQVKVLKLEEELSERSSAPASADVSVTEPDVAEPEEPVAGIEEKIWGRGELAIRQQPGSGTAAIEPKRKADAMDEKARKIGDAQIKRYWRGEDELRKAPRVHQAGLTLHEKILRHFDMSSQYGPCIGILRTKRWKRAHKLGLQPPIEVLAVLLKEDPETSRQRTQRAYVDELVNARLGVVLGE